MDESSGMAAFILYTRRILAPALPGNWKMHVRRKLDLAQGNGIRGTP